MDNLYEDIALRTGGDIYMGVVGPVRTGKSTFIKRFMELMVIPDIDNIYRKERMRDELPQSGSGKTVMTAEPKFIPEEAAELTVGSSTAKIRLIDCVGYMIPEAEGLFEDGQERMVSTPWFDREIPITQAAAEGTSKVIRDHSTIGIVITTDGTIGDIPRESYMAAEKQAIDQLRDIGKPFILLLNSATPNDASTVETAHSLEELYRVPCLPISCPDMTKDDIHRVMETLLYQFPMRELSIQFPAWVEAMPMDWQVKQALCASVLEVGGEISTMHDVRASVEKLKENSAVSDVVITGIEAGKGIAYAKMEFNTDLYYETISEQSGFTIRDDGDLMELLHSLRARKDEYDHVHEALEQARQTGYGVIMPSAAEMTLEQPQIVSRGGRYSVRMKATAPAIHLFQTQVETEVTPAVGGEGASEEIVSFLLQGFDGDVNRIWDSNIFGKSLNDIAEEGITAKLTRMPPNVRNRLRTTTQRVVNDGGYGLICIIL